ncbi:MAG: LPS-assembly protein LptD [Burkholderiales bacterium]
MPFPAVAFTAPVLLPAALAVRASLTQALRCRPVARAHNAVFALSPVALLVASLLHNPPSSAQSVPTEAPLRLQLSRELQERPPLTVGNSGLTFVSADRSTGRPDLETILEGNAQLRRGETVISADRLEYYHPGDLAKARGNVRINRAGNVFEGDVLELKVESFEGFFSNTRYRFLKNDAYGVASRIDFIDDKRAVVSNATYTTCQREPFANWMPDWILTADTIKLDSEADVGRAEGAVLRFKGVPVLPVPSIEFPLSERRKSGFLPPSIGLDSVDGAEFSLPYYWDIAPNRDATFTPEIKTKRGVNLGAEFRYLEDNYNGTLRASYLPSDRLRDRDRWGYSINHQASFNTGLKGFEALGLSLNLNRVSDDDYWRDFSGSSRNSNSLTQRILPSEVALGWGGGDFAVQARSLKWQTLQAIDSPIIPPYDRLPQVTARYGRNNLSGFDLSLEGDYTQFEADTRLTAQPNARRSFALGQVSYPIELSGLFVKPKVQLHATRYEFDAPLANGARTASRVLPTFSLDSGLVFEREASYLGTAYTQTLEPRAFYVYTPFREQRFLPNYDSAANDFNFATIYTENPFGGNDRIADNNLFTLGVTSRLLNPLTGAEVARFGVAQRLRLSDQQVVLPGDVPVADRLSDVLVGGSVNLTPAWGIDTTVQYNPKTERSERAVLGGRYNPGSFRVLSAAYRLQRGQSEQLDIGWQWPLASLLGSNASTGPSAAGKPKGGWYTVGRLNYSLRDSRLVDSLIGFEYDGCCYIARVVLERLQRSGTDANTRIMFQMEFVGFSRLGSNPLRTLKESIPRYQPLGQSGAAPSRFSNYE